MKRGGRHSQGKGGGILTALACLCLGSVAAATADQQRLGPHPAAPHFAPHFAPRMAPGGPRQGAGSPRAEGNARPGGFSQHPVQGPGLQPGQQTRQQLRTMQPPRPGQQHLPEWFERHQAQTPQQQEQALRGEPGFSRLPSQQQQNLVNRLHTLDNASPAQRARMLARNENFEHLPPERRQEIRGAGQALGQMPPDRQHMVRRAFQDLRNLPPEQRQNALNSARFQAEYSPQERTILSNLLTIEPYQP